MFKKIVIVLFAISISNVSCDKEEITEAKSKTDLLCSKAWRISGLIQVLKEVQTDVFPLMPLCAKDNDLIFYSNGSIKMVQNIQCENEIDYNGSWKFSSDQSSVESTFDNLTLSYKIIELSETTLKYRRDVNSADIDYQIYTWIH